MAGVELVFRYEGRAGLATHRASLAADGGSACLELRTLSGGGGLSGGLGGGLGGSSTGAQRLEPGHHPGEPPGGRGTARGRRVDR